MAKQVCKQEASEKECTIHATVSYSVMPHIATMRDADGKTTQYSNGWILARETEGGKREYCGQGLCWLPRPVIGVPFPDQETAQSQLEFHLRQDAAVAAKLLPIESLITEIPYCHIAQGSQGSGQFTLRLTADELWIVQAVRTALQRMNQETTGGQRVESDAAAIRWMLRSLLTAALRTKC